jgi:hypothetical protein
MRDIRVCRLESGDGKFSIGAAKIVSCFRQALWVEVVVGVLDRQTYQGDTRGSRLCGEDRDRETENSKVCARTRNTRFIQVRAAKVANPTSCLGDQVWRPALGVVPGGIEDVRLGTRPSFI